MDEKKLEGNKVQENENGQGVLELIEDSLGDVSGGVRYESQNLDNYDHWQNKIPQIGPPKGYDSRKWGTWKGIGKH